MPRNAETNGLIDICAKPLKTGIKTNFLFLYFFANFDEKICHWAKNGPMLAARLVYWFILMFCGAPKFCWSRGLVLVAKNTKNRFPLRFLDSRDYIVPHIEATLIWKSILCCFFR